MKPESVEFARVVAEIVCEVPEGKVATYGDIATLAGFPTHARLVGKILGSIGTASSVPCHRIVNAQGRTAPHWLEQRALLLSEGIEFTSSGHVDLRRYRWVPPLPE